jgi:hypothetical protein
MTTKDLLRDLMLNHTTAIGFGYSSKRHFTFEWAATQYEGRYVLDIEICGAIAHAAGTERVVLSGERLGVTVCDFHELPTVLEAIERVLPREEKDA